MKKTALLALLVVVPAFAQQPPPQFEVADVRVSSTARGFGQNFGGVLREGHYVNRDATILQLIEAAYGVSEDNIAGGPGWMSLDLFDVIAKVPDGTTPATANLMLQALLTNRFGLVAHRGTQPVPRYVLTVAKGGSKLKPSSGAGNPSCQAVQPPTAPPADLASTPNIKVTCRNLTGAAIADNLHQMANGYFDHDVVDATKLEGTWDFDLEWTPRGALAAKGADGLPVFEAVEKQLGLKADLQNIPMDSFVVERVNRKPTPNPAGMETALALAAARFEAAQIKPADPDARPFVGLLYTGGSQMRAGGTLRQMIAMALQVSPNIANDVVLGLPKVADTQRWEITAKVPSSGEGAPNIVRGRPVPPPLSVGLEMLRGLLVDQFGLKTHTENREVTVYALTLASGKPKLTPANESERSGCKPDPNATKPAANINTMISCKNTTMADLAQSLQQMANAYMDHPVVDATGLAGGWDFFMGWTPKAMMQPTTPATPQANGATVEAAVPDGITVFDAVEKELGLKLVTQKRSVPVIVVDHVNEKPIE
jgi:uncharacterized protein (TIGR03435 family)